MNNFGNNFQQPLYGNNPLENQLNRLNQMQQHQQMQQMQQFQNNFNQNQQMQQQAQPPMNIVKPVTSIEEVRSITPNFDGSKLYFEDVTNGKMYIKYLGFNGLPVLELYSKDENPQIETQSSNQNYASKSELEELKVKMAQYEAIFNELMGGNKNES